jgi:hypothetical protein
LVIGWVGFAGLGDNDTDFAVLHVSLELWVRFCENSENSWLTFD